MSKQQAPITLSNGATPDPTTFVFNPAGSRAQPNGTVVSVWICDQASGIEIGKHALVERFYPSTAGKPARLKYDLAMPVVVTENGLPKLARTQRVIIEDYLPTSSTDAERELLAKMTASLTGNADIQAAVKAARAHW